ncbi:MAG: alanine--glyoxylate aminotransferase family protein [Acidobacteria bacterium]|nr:MAG: alanine--glyoxylate aminotransferase family protein [Acidobacteriota bacterium]
MTPDPQLPPPLDPPARILLGPGPSNVSPRVLAALAKPTLGHLDPAYLEIMDRISAMLRRIFRTENRLTLPVSGTGTAGMEAAVVNLIEPGERMIVGVIGYFGDRMLEIARRAGADVYAVEVPWGETLAPRQIAEALDRHPGTKVVGVVHAETSTGAEQPLDEISAIVHDAGALLVVDAVASLGGIDVRVDDQRIDACYSGSQKCLSGPPGLAPVTFSPAAVEAILNRATPVRSWYLDMSLIQGYWGGSRSYHHTAPINMTYALYEALAVILEEGLDQRLARHQLSHRALRAGLEALGLRYVSSRPLAVLNAVAVPEGVDDQRVRRRLLAEYGIEVGAGLGPFAGKVWRIGIMGESCRRQNVILVLAALEALLADEGVPVDRGAALAAANAVYEGA